MRKAENRIYGKVSLEEVFRVAKSQKDFATFFLEGKKYGAQLDLLGLQMFRRSRCCVSCGLVGLYFLVQQHIPGDTLTARSRTGACYVEGCMHCRPFPRRFHIRLNLYGERGGLVLMTKDHIRPKSMGGRNELNNLQTMCERCNRKKSNSFTEAT